VIVQIFISVKLSKLVDKNLDLIYRKKNS